MFLDLFPVIIPQMEHIFLSCFMVFIIMYGHCDVGCVLLKELFCHSDKVHERYLAYMCISVNANFMKIAFCGICIEIEIRTNPIFYVTVEEIR